MSTDETLLSRPKSRAVTAKQQLVVRGAPEDSQPEVLSKLTHLESSLVSVEAELKAIKGREPKRWDARTLVALAAIALSITGYVIQDARASSRQDAEIEMMRVRIVNLEAIAAANTESRIRTEVELKALREGQQEIKHLLQQHDTQTQGMLQRGHQ
jgi:soluble cytochrome b562